jgi:hypothetical protein
MVLFIAYAFFVLFAVAKHRRRWIGVGYLMLGLAGIFAFGYLHYLLSIWTRGTIALPLMQAMLYPYGFFVFLLSAFAFCLPRAAEAHSCRRCGYDLTGQEELHVNCPECGLAHNGERHPSEFCGICKRPAIAAAHARCLCPPPLPEPTAAEALARAESRRRAARSLLGTQHAEHPAHAARGTEAVTSL